MRAAGNHQNDPFAATFRANRKRLDQFLAIAPLAFRRSSRVAGRTTSQLELFRL